MKRITLMLATFLLTVAGGVIAQQSNIGGLPSRPRFQAVTVGAGTGALTGQIIATRSAGGENAALSIKATGNAGIGLRETGAASDAKQWDIVTGSGSLLMRTVADDSLSASTFLRIDRTAMAVTDVEIGNTTDNPAVTINGSPALTQIYCTTACGAGLLRVGQTLLVTRPNDATVASSASYANDLILYIAGIPDGNYTYEIVYRMDAGAGGLKAQIGVAGVAADVIDHMSVRRCSVGAVVAASASTFTTIGATNDCGAGAGNGGAFITGTAQFTGGVGVNALTLQWAQSSSNVAVTTLRARSFIRLTRLS